MAGLLLSAEERGIVTFWIWNTLAYPMRLLLSIGCILAGFGLQSVFALSTRSSNLLLPILPGAVLLLIGNLFLLVRGYDNRIKLGKFSADAGWEQVTDEKLLEVEELVTRMRKWDRSFLDVSNTRGKIPFIAILIGLWIAGVYAVNEHDPFVMILAVDIGVLLLPHWVTGLRGIMTLPNLLLKIKLIRKLLADIEGLIAQHQAEFFMLLKGGETKLPDDVKFRVKIQGQHPDFLGFYGQIVTNTVSSKTYPYLYVVLVAKQGFGLNRSFERYTPSRKIVKEYKEEGDVEVFVIRQHTTRTSGYHTKYKDARRIFLEGLEVAEKSAVEP
jgi:hypothetical protein